MSVVKLLVAWMSHCGHYFWRLTLNIKSLKHASRWIQSFPQAGKPFAKPHMPQGYWSQEADGRQRKAKGHGWAAQYLFRVYFNTQRICSLEPGKHWSFLHSTRLSGLIKSQHRRSLAHVMVWEGKLLHTTSGRGRPQSESQAYTLPIILAFYKDPTERPQQSSESLRNKKEEF